jgi:hypothetical protein
MLIEITQQRKKAIIKKTAPFRRFRATFPQRGQENRDYLLPLLQYGGKGYEGSGTWKQLPSQIDRRFIYLIPNGSTEDYDFIKAFFINFGEGRTGIRMSDGN